MGVGVGRGSNIYGGYLYGEVQYIMGDGHMGPTSCGRND